MKLFYVLCCVALLASFAEAQSGDCEVLLTTCSPEFRHSFINWANAFRPGNGYEYMLSFGIVNYFQAEMWCRLFGGALITKGARNETTYRQIFNSIIMQDMTEVYLGLTDQEVEGSFVWNDGVPIEEGWSNWNSGEPNDAAPGEDSVVIRLDGRWNDLPLHAHNDNNRQALCEREIPFDE